MHQVKPAIAIRGGKRTPHVVLSVGTALAALWALGSLVGLAIDLVGGATGTFDYRGSALPLWSVLTFSAIVAAYTTVDTYGSARMTGPNHGLIDYVVEPAGLGLSRLRTWGRPLEVLVQRGETVEIDALLVLRRRGGMERHYRFTVSAPGGSFTFTQPIHIEKLTLVPLDEVARDLGIRVETSGAAAAMERLGVNA